MVRVMSCVRVLVSIYCCGSLFVVCCVFYVIGGLVYFSLAQFSSLQLFGLKF